MSSEKLPALAKALPKTKATLKVVVYWGAGNEAAAKVREGGRGGRGGGGGGAGVRVCEG